MFHSCKGLAVFSLSKDHLVNDAKFLPSKFQAITRGMDATTSVTGYLCEVVGIR